MVDILGKRMEMPDISRVGFYKQDGMTQVQI